MSNLGQGYWGCREVGGTHTRDIGEKDKKICRSTSAAIFSPVFVTRVAGLIQFSMKLKWGQLVAWLSFDAFICTVTYTFFFPCRIL
jgi:hypothetical protein